MPTSASVQRMRVGAELRRLREAAGLTGEQVATALGWSQSKVSRIEAGRTAFTVNDVARLLALYGVREDDVRAELLAATAQDTGESAWIVRAGAEGRRQASMAALESVTRRIRQYQPVLVPGLLQSRAYTWHIAKAVGARDPDEVVRIRMRRQEAMLRKGGPVYEAVLDARALLLRVGSIGLVREQIADLAERARPPRIDLRVIPLGHLSPAISTTGFAIYEFLAPESLPVVWVESLAGDTYFSAPEDVQRFAGTFEKMQEFALSPGESVGYLRSLSDDIERYISESHLGGSET